MLALTDNIDVVRVGDDLNQGGLVIATHETELKIARYRDLKEAIKRLEKELAFIKDEICCEMQDRDTIVDTNGEVVVTWNYCKGANRFNLDEFREAYPSLAEQYSYVAEPTRQFRVK